MSTYYSLACDIHKKQVPFWYMAAGQCGALRTALQHPNHVSMFILEHQQCPAVIIDEHDPRWDEYEDGLDDKGNPI